MAVSLVETGKGLQRPGKEGSSFGPWQ